MSSSGADLKAIALSQQGEAKTESTESEIAQLARETAKGKKGNGARAIDSIVDIQGGFLVLKLVNNKKKGPVLIDGVDDVINPATGRNERIRLLSGVDSIWMKDQKDLPKEYVERNRRSILFESGVCRIPAWDTSALEFVRHCRHFIDNPARRSGSKYEFFAWNPKRIAEMKLKKRLVAVEAMKKAMEAPEEAMMKHAIFLKVAMADELGFKKEPGSIRDEYILKAQDDPKHFLDTFNSKEVEVSYLVKKAIRDGKIDLNRTSGAAHWSKGGSLIGHIPSTTAADKFLTELALTPTKDGAAFLEQLERVSG